MESAWLTRLATPSLMAVCSSLCTASVPTQPWFPQAPPLPAPTGEIIEVATVDELLRAVEIVRPGGTIMVADGHYMVPRYFAIKTDGVTLRGASGNRDSVIIDGAESRHGELLGVTGCSGVTIADLTVQNVKWNGFKLNTDSGVQRVTIRNCVIHNVWQRGVKAVKIPREQREQLRPRDHRIQYCLFYNDRPKRYSDDETDTAETFGGNYIGGIDAMYATGWKISDNVFIGIRGRTGEARGAIFLWHDSRDCVIERNMIIDCDSGICLGNSHRGPETKIHCTRCICRNNFLTNTPENGILADYTADCVIAHNTVHDPDNELMRLIRLVHDNHGLMVANNLLSGPPMRREMTVGDISISGNITRVLTDAFVDVRRGDLHLRGAVPGVTDCAPRLDAALRDIDGQERGDPCDAGADEVVSGDVTFENQAGRQALMQGTNDDIQALIDEVAERSGGEVLIPPGEYLCHNSVMLADNTSLCGEGEVVLRKSDGFSRALISDCGFYYDRVKVAAPSHWQVGWGVTLQAQGDPRGFFDDVRTIAAIEGDDLVLDRPVDHSDFTVRGGATVQNVFPLIAGYGVKGATVDGMVCDGNREANPALNGCRGGAIYLFRSEGCRIRNCVARNFNGDGISFQVSPHTTVEDCEVHSNAGLGLHPGAGSHHTNIRDCDVHENEGGGLFLCWRVAHSRFEGNHIHNNAGHGISVGHKDTDNLFEGNLIEGNGRHGVYLRDEPEYNAGHRCTFRDNTIRNNGRAEDAAIWIDGYTASTRIIDNEIADDREIPASCALHIGPNAGQVQWENNTVTGLERIVSPDSAPVDVRDGRP